MEPASRMDSGDVPQMLDHLFRHEAGRMVATLTRIFGVEHLSLAEDVVQEALARALRVWPFYGRPDNPSAWIMRTARNLALDVVRRQAVFRSKEPEIARLMERHTAAPDAAGDSDEIADDHLRLMFVCCHPFIPEEARIALTLRTLCGFGVAEISRAFLSTEAAIARRITRAKQQIREAGLAFEIPEGEALSLRLHSVLRSLYLLFNEGYKASSGDLLVREDVCGEAIRLTDILAQHPAGNQPATHALLALMLLNAARFPARADEAGHLLRLQDQDRTLWDRSLLARGMFHFARSAAGGELSDYHLQSAIAAAHCAAPSWEATDWAHILRLYDHLLGFDDSPVIALNRAIVVANLHGPTAGIEAIEAMADRRKLANYPFLHATLGDFEWRQGNTAAAAAHFHRAAALAGTTAERQFLHRRIAECEGDR